VCTRRRLGRTGTAQPRGGWAALLLSALCSTAARHLMQQLWLTCCAGCHLGVKCGADLVGRSDYDVIQGTAKLLKPAAAHAAFSFTGGSG
jgi:hypothetical protein